LIGSLPLAEKNRVSHGNPEERSARGGPCAINKVALESGENFGTPLAWGLSWSEKSTMAHVKGRGKEGEI